MEESEFKYEVESKNVIEGVLSTGIKGFDNLFEETGIPRGNASLVAGGPGTGKSTFCRQICYNLVSNSKKCMYVSFEEGKDRIVRSMENFDWDVQKYVDDGSFLIQVLVILTYLSLILGFSILPVGLRGTSSK